MKAKFIYPLLLAIFTASATANIVITEYDNHAPSNIPYGHAVASISGTRDALNVNYRDNKQDGHCPYVKTQRIRSINGRRTVIGRTIEHGQNCSTGRTRTATHFISGDGGSTRMCLSGHWYCGGWRDQY